MNGREPPRRTESVPRRASPVPRRASPVPKLIRVQRLDSLPAVKVEYTPEGYLVDNPIVTSVGIFDYKNPDGSIRRELRLPEYVFADKSLASYECKPVIITHDAGRVTKNNVDDEIVGTILSKGYRDGNDVRCKIVIHSIDEVQQSGLRELSLGYDLVLDETPGVWNGQPYDAIQTDIMINHLALVREARAGDQARLNIDGKHNDGQKKPIATDIIRPTDVARQKGVTNMAKAKRMSIGEVKRSIAAYNTRRKHRMDEAEEAPEQQTPSADQQSPSADQTNRPASPVSADAEGSAGQEDIIGEVSNSPTLADRIQLIKDRRDRRDADGTPAETPDAAMGVIAQQDEDIESLLEMIDELQAQSDFVASVDSDDRDGRSPYHEGRSPYREGSGAELTAPPPAVNPAQDDDDEPYADDDFESCAPDSAITIKLDSIDALVRERIKLGRIGDQLDIDGLEDMNPTEAKKLVIRRVAPAMRLDGAGKAYINAAFDMAIGQMKKDTNYQRMQMTGGHTSRADGWNPSNTASGSNPRHHDGLRPYHDGLRPYRARGDNANVKTSADHAREQMIERMMNGGNE